eukprot:Rmarinus@m.27126
MDLQQVNSRLESQINKLEKIIHEQEGLLKEKDDQLDDKQREVDQLQQHVDKLRGTSKIMTGGFRHEAEEYLQEELRTTVSELKLARQQLQEAVSEKKLLKKMLRTKEDDLLKVSKKLEAAAQENPKVVELENTITHLRQQVHELEDGRKSVRKQIDEKTRALDKVTKQYEALKLEDDKVAVLTNELRAKEKQLKQLEEEKATMARVYDRIENDLQRYQKEGPVSYRSWQAEKKALQAEMEKMKNQSGAHERTIKAQQLRINQLEDRLSLAATVKGGKDRSPARLVENGADGRSPRTPSSSSFRCPSGATVPEELYAKVERELVALRQQVTTKTTALLDKDEAVEVLTKKLEVLQHTKDNEIKKLKRETSRLGSLVNENKEQLAKKDEQLKHRESDLKGALFKVKKQLHDVKATPSIPSSRRPYGQ